MPVKFDDKKTGAVQKTGIAKSDGNGRQAQHEREIRQTIADAGRMLLPERLAARTWGNISCRTGERSFAITPSGICYENMKAGDVVLYDMADDTWAGAREPASEKGGHKAVYKRFWDAGAVIHTHQTYASALGLAGFGELSLTDEDESVLGGIALAEYGLPGSVRLMENVSKALAPGEHVILMAYHGVLIVGRDMDEVFRRARLLEAVCRSACRGQPTFAGNGGSGLAELAE